MATSTTDYQTPILCGDCQGHKDVNSYCMACDANLCDKCAKKPLHRKHPVRPRTHPDVIRARRKAKALCKAHPDKQYVMFCNDCKVPLCLDCMNHHRNHSLETSEEAAKHARDVLQSQFSTLVKETLPTSEKIYKTMKDNIARYNEEWERANKESKFRFQCLRKQIDDAEKEWAAQLEKRRIDDLSEQLKAQEETENKIQRTRNLIETCKSKLSQADDLELISFESECGDTIYQSSAPVLEPQKVLFTPSSFALPCLLELVGRLDNVDLEEKWDPESITGKNETESSSSCDPVMVRVVSVKTKGGIRADTLINNNNDQILVSNKSSKTLKFLDQNFREVKRTKYLGFTISDMAVADSGDIIATDNDNNRLVRISQFGEVFPLCSTSPHGAWGVCYTDRHNIVVGHHSPARLVFYSMDGSHVEKVLEKDQNGKSLFTNIILQVKQKSNGDFVVSDRDRIVCVSDEGQYKWEYKVHPCRELTDTPYVFGLDCDPYDNVIIAECFNDKVSLLNSEGRLITTLLTRDDGVGAPYSVSIDKHGEVWIGQSKCVTVKRLEYIMT